MCRVHLGGRDVGALRHIRKQTMTSAPLAYIVRLVGSPWQPHWPANGPSVHGAGPANGSFATGLPQRVSDSSGGGPIFAIRL